MQKTLIRTLSLPILLLSFVVCSNLDQYTNVGSELIDEIDPSRTDFDGNFFPFTADPSIVGDPFVIPAADSFILKRVSDSLVTGFSDTIAAINTVITGGDTIWDSLKTTFNIEKGDTSYDTIRQKIQAAGNMQFTVSALQMQNFKPTDTVTAIAFVLDTIDTAQFKYAYNDPGNLLRLYSCSESYQKNPFAERTAGATLFGSPLSVADTSGKTTYQLELTDSALLASVGKACNLFASCLDSAKKDSSYAPVCSLLAATSRFYFTLFNNDAGSLLRFKAPTLIISHKHAATFDTAIDTTTYYSAFVGSASTVYSKKPRRTTVFPVDLASLWKTISDNNYPEILSAAFVIPGKIAYTETDSDSVALVRYYLSEVSHAGDTALDARIDAATNLYNSEIELETMSTDSLVLPVDFFLQRMLAGNRPPTAYLYLQNFSSIGDWQEIRWNKPRFKAVLTTINKKL